MKRRNFFGTCLAFVIAPFVKKDKPSNIIDIGTLTQVGDYFFDCAPKSNIDGLKDWRPYMYIGTGGDVGKINAIKDDVFLNGSSDITYWEETTPYPDPRFMKMNLFLPEV